jgi:membrane-associated PAP2 superfamily phosphatase
MDSGGFPEREVLPVAARRGWWLSHALAPAVLFLVVLAMLQLGGGDHAVADRLYDADARRWLLDASLPLSRLVYEVQRGVILAVALAGIGVLLAGYWRPDARRWRRMASYMLLCLAVTTALVSAGKHVTNVHCPRALARYGGGYPDVGLFEQRPGGLRRGVCYPAGHSSAAFAFVSLYFALGAWRVRRRWAGLTIGLGAGCAFAAVQWARGMHFPSHDLTSAALAWAVALVVYVALYRRCLWEPGHSRAAG